MNKQLWLQTALQKGFSDFEIYESQFKHSEITWYRGQMDTFVTSDVTGIGLRGIVNGKTAFLSLEEVNDDMMDRVLDRMIEQAGCISKNEGDELFGGALYVNVPSKSFKMADIPSIKAFLASLEEKLAAYDQRVSQVASLSFEQSAGKRSICNSLGLDVCDDMEYQLVVASVVVEDGDDQKDAYRAQLVKDLATFDVDGFVKELVDEAIAKLHSHPLKTDTYPVIMKNEAMQSLLSAFAGLFSGDLIYKGISCLKDKENEKIFSDKITLIDDPTNEDALSAVAFDDEGVPCTKKVLVDKGVFKQALHDLKSAKRMHTQSTGNGFKSGAAGVVGVLPMNMYIEPSDKSFDELVQDMGTGFVITDLEGLHAGIDFVTTNFSLQCRGYWVENGVRKDNITLVTVASNFMDMMKQVKDVANDLEWEYHGIVSPSISFEGLAISGE